MSENLFQAFRYPLSISPISCVALALVRGNPFDCPVFRLALSDSTRSKGTLAFARPEYVFLRISRDPSVPRLNYG